MLWIRFSFIMLRYRITTLGCRVNYAETRDIVSVLRSRGFVEAGRDQAADLEVVHTCSVTNTAAAKSRAAIRRARRRTAPNLPSISAPTGWLPGVIVTGCYAGTDPEDAAAAARSDATRSAVIAQTADACNTSMVTRFTAEVDRWLGTRSKDNRRFRPDVVREPQRPGSGSEQIVPLPVIPPDPADHGHIRAELRIQDGCDAHCTFCIIPKIRRTLRSKTPEDAVREATMLVDRGHREIVLSGVFIGAFGHETALRRKQQNRFASPLADLLDQVAQVPGIERVRISSMEPGDVDEPLLDAMAANRPAVVPHLHLPLQSGSKTILRRMNRQYSIGEYLEMIDQVNETLTIVDDTGELPPAITTDIICGFPGETDADFEQTVAVARRVGYLHMHVFPFSPKRGTAAARWRDQFVDVPVRKQRVRRLIDLETDPGEGLSITYRQRLLHREVRVILEQPARDMPGVMTGRCDHYALIHVRTDKPRGSIVRACVTEVDAERTCGIEIATDVSLPVLT